MASPPGTSSCSPHWHAHRLEPPLDLFTISLLYISLLCGFIAYTLAKLYLFYRIFCFCGSVYERCSWMFLWLSLWVSYAHNATVLLSFLITHFFEGICAYSSAYNRATLSPALAGHSSFHLSLLHTHTRTLFLCAHIAPIYMHMVCTWHVHSTYMHMHIFLSQSLLLSLGIRRTCHTHTHTQIYSRSRSLALLPRSLAWHIQPCIHTYTLILDLISHPWLRSFRIRSLLLRIPLLSHAFLAHVLGAFSLIYVQPTHTTCALRVACPKGGVTPPTHSLAYIAYT